MPGHRISSRVVKHLTRLLISVQQVPLPTSVNHALMELKFCEGGIHKEVMKHIRLFVVMWGKYHIIHNVFKGL